MSLFLRQAAGLSRKQACIRARAWRTNIVQLLQSIVFVALIWLIDNGSKSTSASTQRYKNILEPSTVDVTPIPDCANSHFLQQGAGCYSFLYSPANSSLVNTLVTGIRADNTPPIPAQHVHAFDSAAEVNKFLLANPERVLAAVNFNVKSAQNIEFSIQTNASAQWWKGNFQDPTTYIQIPLQVAVERAFARQQIQKPNLEWNVGLTPFPHPANNAPSVQASVTPTLIVASMIFNVVVLLQSVVAEKESGVRLAMRGAGLQDSALWFTWILFELGLASLQALLLCTSGVAFRLTLFTKNSFALVFALLLTINAALIAFGFLLSSLLRRAASAVPTGFVLFVISWITLIVVRFGFPFDSRYSPIAQAFFAFMPWALAGKALQDLAFAADYGTGLSWGQRYSYCVAGSIRRSSLDNAGYRYDHCTFALGEILWVATIQCVAFVLLAVWAEHVLPDAHGAREPLYYFLLPSYWVHRDEKLANVEVALKQATEQGAQNADEPSDDEDVQLEAIRVQQLCREHLKAAAAASVAAGMHQSRGDATPEERTPLSIAMVSMDARATLGQESDMADLDFNTWELGLDSLPSGSLQLSRNSTRGSHISLESQPCGALERSVDEFLAAVNLNIRMPIVARSGVSFDSDTTAIINGPVGSTTTRVEEPQPVIELLGLRKVYKRQKWWQHACIGSAEPLQAVRGTWLAINQGECFCLLGANGAGKSTTIAMLAGVLPPSAGDALLCGHSISSRGGLRRIRAVTGVCPQFDVLWDSLTAREHLALYGALRGMSKAAAAVEAERLLAAVALEASANACAGTLSGGQRRRLGVALAMVGRPAIVILDEPTTGMDPVARRQLWDLIIATKATGSTVVLSTHSMEEAEALADRLVVMGRGRLRCLGNRAHLKARYGAGHTVSVRVCTPGYQDGVGTGTGPSLAAVRALVKHHLGPGIVLDTAQAFAHIRIPPHLEAYMPALLSALKSLEGCGLQVRQAALLDVFLAVTLRAELEHAQASGQTEELTLEEENGLVITVRQGSPLIQSPSGCMYRVTWIQDEDGSIKIAEYSLESSSVLSPAQSCDDICT